MKWTGAGLQLNVESGFANRFLELAATKRFTPKISFSLSMLQPSHLPIVTELISAIPCARAWKSTHNEIENKTKETAELFQSLKPLSRVPASQG